MRSSSIILNEIQSLNSRITNIQNSYYPASNKAHIVEKELSKLTLKLTDLMCEYHLALETWNESIIDDDYGKQYKISEFRQLINEENILDEDGIAFYVTSDNKETDIQVLPNWILGNIIRPEFNYIIWYRNDEIESLNSEFDGVDYDTFEEEF